MQRFLILSFQADLGSTRSTFEVEDEFRFSSHSVLDYDAQAGDKGCGETGTGLLCTGLNHLIIALAI